MIETKCFVQFEHLTRYPELVHCATKKPLDFSKRNQSEEALRENYNVLFDALNLPRETRVVRSVQTHTNSVIPVSEEVLDHPEMLQDVDGLVTNLRNIALAVSTADCQGILLYDPIRKVIGSVHSGWRGTAAGILKKTVELMTVHYGCCPENLRAGFCPSILSCCFEVDEDVRQIFLESFERESKLLPRSITEFIQTGEIRNGKQKYHIDTVGINSQVLIGMGVPEANIARSGICTRCMPEKYHSFRAAGNAYGMNLALIMMR